MVACGAVIVAAGRGTRMGTDIAKQFLTVGGIEIIARTVEKFEKTNLIGEIVVVVSESDLKLCEDISKKYKWKKTVVCRGGNERTESVQNGLLALSDDIEIVLIHDGVRPFVTENEIVSVINKTAETGACVLAVPVKDTIKICSNENMVVSTPERSSLWAMQTPQGFNFRAIKKAYACLKEGTAVTDDAMVMELAGHNVSIVKGSYKNIKITTPEDIIFGEAMLREENI